MEADLQGCSAITIRIDAAELERDVERLKNGEIELPTVSAVRIVSEGLFDEDVIIWLSDKSRCPMR